MSDPFFMRHLQADSYRGILFPGSALSYGQVVNKEVKMGEKRVTISEEGEGDSSCQSRSPKLVLGAQRSSSLVDGRFGKHVFIPVSARV